MLHNPSARELSAAYLGAAMQANTNVTILVGPDIYVIRGDGNNPRWKNGIMMSGEEQTSSKHALHCVDSLFMMRLGNPGGNLVPYGEVFPPVRDLYSGLDWHSTREEVDALWDLSQLRTYHTSGTWCGLFTLFLSTIPFEGFRQVQKLQLDAFESKETTLASEMMFFEFIGCLHRLEDLTIHRPSRRFGTCNISAVIQAGQSLRRLSIDTQDRGHRGRDDGVDEVSLFDLKRINTECPNLEELEFDHPLFPYRESDSLRNRTRFEAQETLDFLPRFERLKHLWMHFLWHMGSDPTTRTYASSTDPDWDDASRIAHDLQVFKIGLPFEIIRITLQSSTEPLESKGKEWREDRNFVDECDSGGLHEL